MPARGRKKTSVGRLLVHTCCGPCFLHPERTLDGDWKMTVLFCNPNVHPRWEWARRRDIAAEHCKEGKIPFESVEYAPDRWSRDVLTGGDDSREERCPRCYAMRLDLTAAHAAKHGFDAFTTTLLVSPHQDHEAVRAAGEEAAEKHGIRFLYEDFRDGYKWGVGRAKQLQLYRQNYCGCVLSLIERGPVYRLAKQGLTKG